MEQPVTANLSPVRLEMDHGHMIMYFCPMRAIEVLETINKGDGGRIPDEAKVDGLSVPANYKPGFYNLEKCNINVKWNNAGKGNKQNHLGTYEILMK